GVFIEDVEEREPEIPAARGGVVYVPVPLPIAVSLHLVVGREREAAQVPVLQVSPPGTEVFHVHVERARRERRVRQILPDVPGAVVIRRAEARVIRGVAAI